MKKKSQQPQIKQTKVTCNADIVNAIINQAPSKNDPNGSYTGKPLETGDVPTQDADDL